MDAYLIIKTIHILSSTILFGTGIGIAFFMLRTMFTQNIHEKYYAIQNTVLADNIFTLPAVIIQPLSGIALIAMGQYNWADFWLICTYALYLIAGLCWLPVVWLQIQMRNMIRKCIASGEALPARYFRFFKIWFMLGWPAFISLICIFYLMVAKPS